MKNANRQPIGDAGVAVQAFGDGEVTGFKNAKRGEKGDGSGLISDIGVAVSAFADGDVMASRTLSVRSLSVISVRLLMLLATAMSLV